MYKSFEEMPVWREAFELASEVYDLIEKFPRGEQYALTDQVKRAAISVGANIAESFGRYHILDKINFYFNARGSLCETKSHLLFALNRQYITNDDYEIVHCRIDRIFNDINVIIKSLKLKYKK